MKKILLIAICSLLFPGSQHLCAQKQRAEAAYKVIERVSGQSGLPVKFSLKPNKEKGEGSTYFQYKAAEGRLMIEGNSPVALCRGFYDFIKSNRSGIYSWSGSNVRFPEKLEDIPLKRVVSPFENHFMCNVVVYGYSMPYWDWDRWEKEIDWMALHGINMPLALVGYEAILARVWKKMGLTDDEINHYFVGPAHLPWMRMGNISGIDGPLNEDWHRRQIDLQHKILKRMKELGMKPICPGFPGFIPEAFKRIYPDLEIIQTHWGGAFCNWMISPQEELFTRIGTEFIHEWEKEFGENEHYLVDSFNEMDIPFPAKGSKERYDLLASYGDKVYQSIRKGNPKATWVMQGWMFGYQRDIWDYETLGALLSEVPDDKMLLLDLAVDYNKHFWKSEVNWEFYKGFYNKPWVYSVIPNMGGKTGMTGVLDFYANGHLEALSSPDKGRLIAHGMAPEGIENNEVIYELLSDAGWSDKKIDIHEWLKEYSYNRYGSYPTAVRKCWDLLLESVYGTFTDHPRYNWQFRPGTVRNGSICLNESFFKAIESFVDVSGQLKDNPLYLADLSEFTALYLGGKAELLVKAIDWQYEIGDTVRAVKFEKDFEYLLTGIDALLSVHPTLRLERWIDFAHKQAVTPEQHKQYERNAKRIVTIWGPPVDDYSARVWSGLIRDYYLPRWKHYFESRKAGVRFDFAEWEKNWVESEGCSPLALPADIVNTARSLVDYAAFITPDLIPDGKKGQLGSWTVGSEKTEVLSFQLPADKLEKLSSVQIERKRGGSPVVCSRFKLVADGKVLIEGASAEILQGDKLRIVYPVTLSDDIRGNNGVELQVQIENTGSETASGQVSVIEE
ncbi:alpha-N-acetylglucosaminidase [Parabacteroides faecis]|uniref:alpha-N-acetylglucosaminidase n=1 Tax=Parabacteroides TaxID=375288 RepID=UPI000EFE2026|nr:MULTISPECIES: alpha-N-acetylglucosaminidase [Parabacteroides]MBC8616251.1 alpha-N-acetylglucosaminidase [Parabacteroides faecis]RHR98376.1 alpha-N-acetylglucosaminidase [Parabacteroides sp. AF14-59]